MLNDHDHDHERSAEALLRFNRDMLDAAIAVVDGYERHAPRRFAEHAGPHLRHVIEHHEALIARRGGVVDYDARKRDRSIERDPALARARLRALQVLLAGGSATTLAEPVTVRTLGGLGGELQFETVSTVGRELMFVASHAVHHFAVLKLHALADGIAVAADLGKAPATVAHERATEAA